MSPVPAIVRGLAVTWLLLLGGAACGSDAPSPSSAGSAGSNASGGGSGGLSAGPDLGNLAGAPVGAGEGDEGGDVESCAGELVEARPLPLDMYIMLDVSGSMLSPTEGDPAVSKWQAVSTALAAFVGDAGSDGMGLGLQVFPLRDAEAPLSCTNDAQCGKFGPCFNRACWPLRDGELLGCLDDGNCLVGQTCVLLGECAADASYVCNREVTADCGMNLGACETPPSPCLATADCRPASYAQPAAPITTLPAARDALLATLQDAEPDPEGGTPTGPALTGAIDQAAAWASTHGDRQAVAVLATDGLPTLCEPISIGAVAAIAAAGRARTPSVSTFVIGVFGSEDPGAPANLDSLARAGGTDSAFIVDTQGDVTTQFRAALEQIRASRLSCDLAVPQAEAGKRVDYDRVNVVFDDGTGPVTLGYARDAAGCDPDATRGGWYFDTDPETEGQPRRILACPATCERFRQAAAGSVQIELGCQRRDVVK